MIRRDFLTTSGGLVLGFVITPRLASAQAIPANIMDPPRAGQPNAYVRIAPDDSVTLLIPRAEMGQGALTGCAQMLAEELECDWAKVKVDFAPVIPDIYGVQTSVGSLSTRTTWDPLRNAGAEAREMLIAAAAQQWNVAPAQCRAENGFVINTASNARVNYGAIAAAAAKLPVPTKVPLKNPSQFRIIGKAVKRSDTRDKVMATTQFGLDAHPAGLKHAVVERCPVFGGTVVSVDASKAKAVPGVRDVFQVPSGVAVIADNTWAALQGRKALRVEWNEGANATVSSATIRQQFMTLASTPAPKPTRKVGDAVAALARATRRVDAVYDYPFLAHATMEPMNCTIHARPDGTAEAWVATQSPTTSRVVIAEVLRIAPEKVTFHTLYCGGGFGRRGEGEMTHVYEAAEIAKRVEGPIKVTWTREDDMQHDLYRPAGLAQLVGAVDADGWPAVLKATVVASMGGGLGFPYPLPDLLIESHTATTHVPVSYWRAPGASGTAFVAESFFDELCAAGGKDPVEARRRMLAKSPRLLNVLNITAEKAGWGRTLPPGRGLGVAIGDGVGSSHAMVAEVSVAKGRVRVHKVVCAFDAGQIINPHLLTQQVSGGIIFGLSAGLKGAITIERGRVQQANFDTYDMVRMDESPEVDVHLVPSTERPAGAGEAANPTIIPAVTNAIFAATGKRIRSVPIRSADLV